MPVADSKIDGPGDQSNAVSRRVLEEYKSGRLTEAAMQELLGFRTRYQLDGFLKTHGVDADYTIEDFQREVETLKRIGV